MNLLELQSIHKQYGSVVALNGASLQAEAGTRTAIVGASGSGKTTLLRIIAGFEAPDAGQVRVDGRVLADGATMVPAHQRGIGYVPQDGALFPHLSVADNVGFGLPRHAPDRAQRVNELMDMVALDRSMLTRRPHQLSGGQQQRVALARALALKPRLVLLDEPFSALDTGLRAATRKAVAQLLSAAGITSVLVTHDQAEALSFADQVAVMRAGVIAQAGPPRELYQRPIDAATALFLGDAVVLPALIGDDQAECALGRVPVLASSPKGQHQIMLRPEQLRLLPAHDGADALRGQPLCRGIVRECDFTGGDCLLSVEIIADAAPLLVRCAGIDAPVMGAAVQIGVVGTAHVFAD